MDFFNASGPLTGPGDDRDPLLRLQAIDADQRIRQVLDDVEEMLAQSEEREAAEEFDPGLAQLLDSVAGADDAPLEFRSLRRRVAEGRLTWQQFWLHPEEEAGGAALIDAVMKAETATLAALLAGLEDESPDDRGR